MKKNVRVRFAPAPTGMMHLGNVRTALMNYLFARQYNGSFILRIEDTDSQRNFDPEATHIIKDLDWLNISFDEGPNKGGPYGPYFQSKRMAIYEEKRADLEKKGLIYRCFCSTEELEKKRQRQRMLKQPPRYDRTCTRLSADEIVNLLQKKIPFVWRFKLDHNASVTITDLAHGNVTFELKNFSDFPITRQDGSFTFIFANFVDDAAMHITHVFRGEDHLSNTANQAALYQASNLELPIFWHMPILCSIEGKKLSKRDFGFSLRDLKDAGFVPEAIDNYLSIIGGSYSEEIMPMPKLIENINFKNIQTTGQIKYDVEKLRWINHKWIVQYEPEQLTQACKPFLQAAYSNAAHVDDATLTTILQIIKTDLVTLADSVQVLRFYFQTPQISHDRLRSCTSEGHAPAIAQFVRDGLADINNHDLFVDHLKIESKKQNIPLKETFCFVRMALMGNAKGPSIHDLLAILGTDKAKQRLEKIVR